MDADETLIAARPFDLGALPDAFPPPSGLVLWVATVVEPGGAP